MMAKELSKKTLTKSFHNWYYGNLTCFSQEHMQTFGYLCSMLPIVEELYDKKEDQAKSMKTYTAFFNTEPQIGTVVVGITAGLEVARANGAADVDDETINGLRAGLMGPLAGIGDSLIVGTKLIPNEAANVKPKKKGMKSTALVTICFNRIAIPTQGSKDPTVNKVFIAKPSIGKISLINSTTSAPNLHMIKVGIKEKKKWEIQGKPILTAYSLRNSPFSTAFQPMCCHAKLAVAVP